MAHLLITVPGKDGELRSPVGNDRALLCSDVRCYECLVKRTFLECAVTGQGETW
jgi:hypothetical protein